MMLLLALRGLRVVRDFAHPGDLMHISTVPIYLAREVQHHRPVYRSWDQPPYLLALYGPLLYFVPGMLARLFNPDVESLLRLGRALSLAATAGSCVVLALVLRRWARATWPMALLLAGLFAASEAQWPVCMEPRSDAAETLFILLGVVACLRLRGGAKWWSIPLFILAFLYKQSAIIAPVVIVVFEAWRGRPRRAVVFGAVSAASLIGVVAILAVATDGHYLLNCFTGMRAHITFSNLITVWSPETLASVAMPFFFALHRLVRFQRTGHGAGGRRRRRCPDLPTVAFPVLMLWALSGIIRDGSGRNYFIAPLAMACLSAGRELSAIRRRTGMRSLAESHVVHVLYRFRQTVACGIIVSVALPLLGLAASSDALIKQVLRRAADQRLRRETVQLIAEKVNAMEGSVLFDEGVLSFYCARPVMLDLLTFTGLADVGAFDDRPLLDMIERRQLAAFVLRFPLEAGEAPRYQSTARVRQAWVDAMRRQRYEGLQYGWLYVYLRPEG